MQVYYTDQFVLPLPPGHSFPMARYRLLREAVQERRLVPPQDIRIPPAASDDQLRLVHTADYLSRVTCGTLTEAEQRRIGFPWSREMVERCRRSTGGTLAAARAALLDGIGINLAGGTHHAFADRGGGYCVFNDVAVSVRTLQSEGAIRRAVVLDCDVHHGDGTAEIFEGDDSVFTISLFAAKAFPARKPPGDLDFPLPPGTGDEPYLSALDQALQTIQGEGGFDILFYLAGADPYEGDRLGGLAVTKPALAERDRRVLSACRAWNLPVVITMAGGYADDVREIVAIQTETVALAADLFRSVSRPREESPR